MIKIDTKYFGSNILDVLQDNNTFVRATGTAAISLDIGAPSSTEKWKLKDVRLTLSTAAGTGVITIKSDNAEGAVYDHLFNSQELSAYTYYKFRDDNDIVLNADDKIKIEYGNPGGLTYGLEVITEIVHTLV